MSVRLGMSVRAVTRRLWKRLPIDPCNRTLTSSTAFDRKVNALTTARPSFSAATQAVAHPQKGSSTTIVSGVAADALMMRSSRARGFCVG